LSWNDDDDDDADADADADAAASDAAASDDDGRKRSSMDEIERWDRLEYDNEYDDEESDD
jgi:hypothetical protein